MQQANYLFDAIGDSITVGLADNYSRDNLTLTDQRSLGFQGWPAILADLLTNDTGGVYPSLIANEGIRGDKAEDIDQTRLASILERTPNANRTVMLLGTNNTGLFGTIPERSGMFRCGM